MNTPVKYLLTLLLLLTSSLGWGKEVPYYFETLGREDGLSHSMVYDLLQDSRGFIWVATKKGLNRYDGASFKVYMKEPQAANGLTDDTFYSLLEDREGTIWAGTAKGLFAYSPEKELFTDVDLRKPDGPLVKGAVHRLASDPSGNIWAAMSDTCVFRLTPSRQSTCYSLHRQLSPEGKILGIYPDSEGNLWLATLADGLFKLDPRSGEIQNFKFRKGARRDNDFTSVILLAEGYLLVGTQRDGVIVFNLSTLEFEQIDGIAEEVANGSGGVLDLYKSADGEIYAGTENGMYLYTGNELRHFTHERTDRYSIAGGAVCSILKDREGGVWAVTYYGGLCHHSDYLSQFEKYYPVSGRKDELTGQNIRQFCNDGRGGIYVGTEDGGLDLFDTKTGKFQRILPGVKTVNAVELIDGQIYIGTEYEGLFTCDPATLKTTLHPGSASIPERMIHSISSGSDGQLWIGSDIGLYAYRDGAFHRINEKNIRSRVHNILEDDRGNLWVATGEDGVWKFNAHLKNWQNYTLCENSLERGCPVICLFEDSKGLIWAGTEGSGLYCYDSKSDSFHKHYSTANGLPDVVIYSIVEDGKGRIWGSTNRGIFRLDPISEAVQVFDTRHGLPFDQFNYNAGLLGEDGKIYFGGIEGFTAFDPLCIKPAPYKPALTFSDFSLAGDDIKIGTKNCPLEKSIILSDEITLHPEQENFSISFTDLFFSPAPEATFSFNIEDLSSHWSEAEKGRPLAFSSIPIGNHTLRIRVEHPTLTEPVEKSIVIRVLPPWYKNTLAHIIYVIVCMIALYLNGQYIVKRIRQRDERILRDLNTQKEKELYNSKIDFFTKLTAELKTPLTMISEPLETVLSRTRKDTPEFATLSIVRRNANRLIKLLDDLLNFRKIGDTHNLNYIHTSLSDTLEALVDKFPSESYSHDISINIKVIPEGLEADIDREIFAKIFNNLLSNALKNAQTYVNISAVLTDDGNFRIYVSNDGLRIPKNLTERIFDPFVKTNPSTRGVGIGLPFARNLAETHGGKLFLSRNDSPVEFTLELPLTQKSALGPISENIEANAALRSQKEENFSEDLTKFIDNNLADPDLDVEKIAKGLNLSIPTLYRRLKAISDLTPNDFVKLCRLKKAAALLQERDYKVNEIASIVGFGSSSYFSKCFYKQFGVLPKYVDKDTEIPAVDNKI